MTDLVLALQFVIGLLVAAIVALGIDCRRRIRAERVFRENEAQVRLVLDHSPAMLWTARPEGPLDYLNSTCAEFTGESLEKLREEGWLDLVHPEDRARIDEVYGRAIAARAAVQVEYRMRAADGAYHWLLAKGLPRFGPDGAFAGFVGCDIDITERREAEDRMRDSRAALEVSHREIQDLAGRLIETQDAERSRIARDLHDDVSQQVAGVSIALSSLKHRLEASPVGEELKADLGALHQRTAALAQNVRHLSHDLHPTVLRHVGLVTALASHCAELERSHPTTLTCSAEGELESIDPTVALCLYRIAQEALRNVVAHAGASRADVQLLRSGDRVELTVADDGRGFDIESSLEAGAGLGLVSIRERVRLARGTVRFEAGVEQGTRVHVQVPLGEARPA